MWWHSNEIMDNVIGRNITLHYITLHYITLHYITLHYITLHYITLHYITLHYITSHHIYRTQSEDFHGYTSPVNGLWQGCAWLASLSSSWYPDITDQGSGGSDGPKIISANSFTLSQKTFKFGKRSCRCSWYIALISTCWPKNWCYVNCKPLSLLNIKADSYTLSNTSFFVEFGLGITVIVIEIETIEKLLSVHLYR